MTAVPGQGEAVADLGHGILPIECQGRRRRWHHRVVSECELCGRPTDGHDRHVRFRLPDPVLDAPGQDRGQEVWKTDEDPNLAVMMMHPEVGPFVRALLAVRLTGAHTVTFGVWVGVTPEDLRRAFDAWWAPGYPDLTLQGRLANAVPPWDVLGARVSLAVKDPKATPYCVASDDPLLSDVLGLEWDHETVLQQLPG